MAPKYVRVVLVKDKGDEEAREYSRKQWERFDVKQTPTVFLLTNEGWIYGRTGYKDGGVPVYTKDFADWAKQRKPSIKDLTGKLAAAPEDPDLTDQLTDRAGEWGLLTSDYLEMKSKLAAGAKGAAKAQYLADIARYYSDQREQDKYMKYLKQVRAADGRTAQELEIIVGLQADLAPLFEKRQWSAINAKLAQYAGAKGNLGQEVLYSAAYVEYCQERLEKAMELYEKARAAAPKGHRVRQCDGAILHIKSKLGLK